MRPRWRCCLRRTRGPTGMLPNKHACTEMHTGTHKGTQTGRKAERHTQTHTGRQAHTGTHAHTQAHRHTGTPKHTQAWFNNTHFIASKGAGHHSAPQAAPRQYRRSTLCQHTELGEGQQYAQDAVMVMRPPPMLLRVLCATPPRDTDDRVDTRIPPMTCD